MELMLSIMAENSHPILSLHITLVLILLGAPGSGKGTQAKRLAIEYQIPHISTGDLFRENMSADTPLGKKVKEFIQTGKLVPDELVLNMLFDRISKPDCVRGYLLDGFPRTIVQADALTKEINPKMHVMALFLNVDDQVIMKRAEGRLICKQCATIYNRFVNPPLHEGICDKCSGEVYQRPDDASNVVLDRLKIYYKQTQPLLDYYDKKGMLATFNGNQSPDVVYTELKCYIDSHENRIKEHPVVE